MNKAEFIAEVAEKSNLSKKDAGNAINAMVDVITDVIAKQDKLTLVGFGTFETSKRTARTGKNPQTGETIKIPASVVPKFKAGAKLKEAANSKKKKK